MLQPLEEKYLAQLEGIAQEIQTSEELQKYLEEEEDEFYDQLKELFEPRISIIYDEVAAKFPLQLIPFERVLLHEAFEGLFLPKILGFSVLRGLVNERIKYVLPQEHFMDILLNICQSPNFDMLKKRIGQSIQVGFALSSDIWITNLIKEITNKRIRSYLRSHKLDKYRIVKERRIGRALFTRQFKSDNFLTAEFPELESELKVLFPALKHFLLYRVKENHNNESLITPIHDFIKNENFQGNDEHLEMMTIFGLFFELEGDVLDDLFNIFNNLRASTDEFDEEVLELILSYHESNQAQVTPQADLRLSALIDRAKEDKLVDYCNLVAKIHTEGYQEREVIEAIRVYDNIHEGKSVQIECIRRTIFRYFEEFVGSLNVARYNEYFEITKSFVTYMQLFDNEKFNSDLKLISMKYIKKLLKRYTDRRGKDYQDIKKFVKASFVDFGFLTEKEIKELFKAKKKRAVPAK